MRTARGGLRREQRMQYEAIQLVIHLVHCARLVCACKEGGVLGVGVLRPVLCWINFTRVVWAGRRDRRATRCTGSAPGRMQQRRSEKETGSGRMSSEVTQSARLFERTPADGWTAALRCADLVALADGVFGQLARENQSVQSQATSYAHELIHRFTCTG